MQPLIATRGLGEVPEAPLATPRAGRRDPAPSKVAYRLHRLWLTPLVRALLSKGLPTFLLILAAGLWMHSPERRTALSGWVESIRQSIAERPEFRVGMMAIDGASPELAQAIRQKLPVRFPVSSFELDIPSMHAAVLELPAVASAQLRVRRGGVLQVDVVERVPVVIWRAPDGIGTLDATGHPVAPLLARLERPDLPLIVGLGADAAVPEALALLAVAGPIESRIRGLVRVGQRRWDVVVDPDIRLMLPEVDPVPALEQIIALDQAQELLARDVRAVDLRTPSRATVRLSTAAAETYRLTTAPLTVKTGARP